MPPMRVEEIELAGGKVWYLETMRQGAQFLKAGRSPETLEQLFEQERGRMLNHLEVAFRDETGLSAQETELVEEDNGTWRRWFYRRREGAERAMERMPRVTLSRFWTCLYDMRDCFNDDGVRGEIIHELRQTARGRVLVGELEAMLGAAIATSKDS
jgi:hypothetical protein